MAEPRPEREIVFGTTSRRVNRAKRVGRAARGLSDTIFMPGFAKAERGRSESKDRRYAQARIVGRSDQLRGNLETAMQDGVMLRATTNEGAKISTRAQCADGRYEKRVAWSLEIESPTGVVTGFKVDAGTLYPGSQHGHEHKSAHVDVVDPENGREYATYRYGDEAEFEIYASVAVALSELAEAQDQGNLQVVPIPSGVLSQQEIAQVA